MALEDSIGRRAPPILLLACALAASTLLFFPTPAGAGYDSSFGNRGTVFEPVIYATETTDLAEDRADRLLVAIGGRDSTGFAFSRFLADGSYDTSLTGPAYAQMSPDFAEASTVLSQPDGKVLLVGTRTFGVGVAAPGLARFLPNGELDPSFGSGGRVRPTIRVGGSMLHGAALQRDGRIVAAGVQNAYSFRHRPRAVIYRYRPDGRLDRSFGRRGAVTFRFGKTFSYTGFEDVIVLPSGKIYASGYARGNLLLVRLRRDGSRDRRFGDGDGVAIKRLPSNSVCDPRCGLADEGSMAIQSRGRVLVQGNFLDGCCLAIARFRPSGRLDRSFGSRGLARLKLIRAADIGVQRNRRIVVAGTITRLPGAKLQDHFGAVRLRVDGRRDGSFGHGGVVERNIGTQSMAHAALVQKDGRVVIGGDAATERKGPFDGSLVLTRFFDGPLR